LRAELQGDWALTIPDRRLTSAAGLPLRSPRRLLRLRTVVQLDAGAEFARVLVIGDNQATDVRVRIGFASATPVAGVVADAAFGPVGRLPIVPDEEDQRREQAPPTAPLHRYVSVFGARAGATVFSDGLAEYEVQPDGLTWVTLVRAVCELSRHDLPERPGHAGYPVETPGAQCLGPFEARFGFAVHGPPSPATTSLIDRMADDVLQPLRGHTWRTAIAPPARVSGVEIAGDGLAATAIKDSEDGEWMVLRCVNLTDRPVEGAWHCAGLSEAVTARLDETPLTPMAVEDGRVAVLVPPRAVVTVLAR
jgi:alpha-mannosidase